MVAEIIYYLILGSSVCVVLVSIGSALRRKHPLGRKS